MEQEIIEYGMTNLEAITARHSVRAYKRVRIEREKINILKDEIDRLNKEYHLHIQFIDKAGDVFSGLPNKFTGFSNVPSYIALVGRKREKLDELCGYCGERLVLLAQKLDLNTCWAGFFKRKSVTAEIADNEKLVIVIAIGYGKTEGRSRKSKPLEFVTDISEDQLPEWFRCGVTAALLAPTAMNQQKFMFSLEDGKPTAKISSNGPFVKVDLGIVKCHFEIVTGKKVY